MRTMANDRVGTIVGTAMLLLLGGCSDLQSLLPGAFSEGPTEGPLTADGVCPTFRREYPQCTIRFGNAGLSTLGSFYETFVGEGPFEIDGFSVETLGERRFVIVAQSNRGPLISDIHADRIVRLGQDREDEVVYRTHQSAFCDAGRIYEHQVVYRDGGRTVQDLEFWTEDEALYFRLFQDGNPTAEVVCEGPRE